MFMHRQRLAAMRASAADRLLGDGPDLFLGQVVEDVRVGPLFVENP
jgi:hypothetical protein